MITLHGWMDGLMDSQADPCADLGFLSWGGGSSPDGQNHRCILPGLGTYHFSPILLPTHKSGTIHHHENGGYQNFTEAFVTLIVTMLRVQ